MIQQLQTNWIPVAVDNWYHQRRDDEIGKFYWHVVQQGRNKDKSLNSTRQGIYGFTADGVLLGDMNNLSAERMKMFMEQWWARWQALGQPQAAVAAAAPVDDRYVHQPPSDGLVVDVYSRILMDAPPGRTVPNTGFGLDHMWLDRQDLDSLDPGDLAVGATYAVPARIAMRMARFHLIDNVRGEPPMWTRQELSNPELTLAVTEVDAKTIKLRLTGAPKLATRSGDRGYEAELLGLLEWDRATDSFSRFDILATGLYWGEGTYTRGAPPGKYPFAVSFAIAGEASKDRIPPQAARGLSGYYNADR